MDSPRFLVRLLGVVVAACALILLCASADATDINGRCYPNPVRIGVNDQPPDNAAQLRSDNIEWVRITIPWRAVNPSAGTWTWGGIDAMVNAHYAQGNKILAILSTAPEWAGSNANGTRPPAVISLWSTFVREVASRYQGKIQAYEIWNEPDLDDDGVGVGWDGPLFPPSSLPTYAAYVRAAGIEINAYDPQALVVGPVTSSRPSSTTVDVFRSLEEVTFSGLNASHWMDVVSFHANGESDVSSTEVWSRIRSQLSTLYNRNPSNLGKPVWITELGWATYFEGETGQRDKIRAIVERLTLDWSLLYYPAYCDDITKTYLAFIYKDVDIPGASDATRGIYRSDGSPKLVVTDYIRSLPAYAVQPSRGFNPEGYQPFSVSCSFRTCTFTSGWPDPGDGSRIFDWDLGDGTTATGHQVTHTFAGPATYFVYHGMTGVLEWPSDSLIVTVP
jgi:hypothetical protein